jgi:hypothetical protein
MQLQPLKKCDVTTVQASEATFLERKLSKNSRQNAREGLQQIIAEQKCQIRHLQNS